MPPLPGHFPLFARFRLWTALVPILVGAYVVFCWSHASIQPGGADTSGYFNQARALAAGTSRVPFQAVDGLPPAALPSFAYVPLGFLLSNDGAALIPTYPVGLPAFYALSAQGLGWQAGPHAVMVLHALAGVVLMFLLARQAGCSPAVSAIGAATLATAPLYLHFAVQAMSDLPATTWCVLALWLAGRRTIPGALGASLAVGVATLIRPTNLLIVLPVVCLLGRSWRRWLALGAGGAPFAALLAWFNWRTYGSPLATGYGDTSELFSLTWVPATVVHYVRWLPMALSPLALGAAGLILFRKSKAEAGPWWPHALWVMALFGLYACYYHTHETWWYLRFVMPAMPSLLLLALLALDRAVDSPGLRRWRPALLVLALGLSLGNSLYWGHRYQIHRVGLHERVYTRAAELVAERTPKDAVLFAMQASGALFYHGQQTIMRWDMLDGRWAEIRARIERTGRPIYALLFDHEKAEALQGAIPGSWEQIGRIDRIALWRLTTPTAAP